jgi:hypothetical protein
LKIKPFRISAALAIIAIVSAALVACGSSDTAVVAPQDTAAPVAVAVDTTGSTEPAESEDTQVSAPAPAGSTVEMVATVLAPADTTADIPVETNEMAIVDLTPVDDPDRVEALQSEADPEADSVAQLTETNSTESTEAGLLTSYSDYGFALKLDLGADVQTAGWTEPEPSMTQGIIAFSYGGINANLVWGPPEDRTALTFLADTYNILRARGPASLRSPFSRSVTATSRLVTRQASTADLRLWMTVGPPLAEGSSALGSVATAKLPSG